MCDLLSLQVLSKMLLDLRITERCILKSVRKASYQAAVCYSHQIFMKLEFSGHMFDKYSNVKLHVNPTGGGGIVRSGLTEGQTRPRQLCLFASSRECLKINVRFVLYTEIYVCVPM